MSFVIFKYVGFTSPLYNVVPVSPSPMATNVPPTLINNLAFGHFSKINCVRFFTFFSKFDSHKNVIPLLFILSKKSDYGELLYAKTIDLTLPFIRTQEDFELAVKSIKDLIASDEQGNYRRKTFIVIDGIESLTKSALLNDLENYRNLLDYLTLKQKVDVITGVDLMQSIFSGNPGVFVGFGNCLITVQSPEKADVTYVNVDCSLSTPTAFEYPSSPTFLETVASLNTAMEGVDD